MTEQLPMCDGSCKGLENAQLCTSALKTVHCFGKNFMQLTPIVHDCALFFAWLLVHFNS